MTVEELIDKMLERFEGGERWTKGFLAKNSSGYYTATSSDDAHMFCLLGMRSRVCMEAGLSKEQSHPLFHQFTGRFNAVTKDRSISGFNDSRQNFGEIKAVLEAMRENGK